MRKKILYNTLYILCCVFIIINATTGLCRAFLSLPLTTFFIITVGNSLLAVLAAITVFMHYKAVQNSNPNVLIRSVMMSTIMKFVIIGGSAALYVYLTGKNRSISALAIVMALYIVYLVIEVWTTSKMNKVKDVRN